MPQFFETRSQFERAVAAGVESAIPATESRWQKRRNLALLAVLVAILIGAVVDAIIATRPDPAVAAVAEMMRIRSAYRPGPNPSMDNCTAAQQIADTYRKRGDQNEALIWFNTARVDCRRVGVVLR